MAHLLTRSVELSEKYSQRTGVEHQNENATPGAVNASTLKKKPSFSDLVRKSFKKDEKEVDSSEPRKRRPSFSELMKKSFSRGEKSVPADARSEAASETSQENNHAELPPEPSQDINSVESLALSGEGNLSGEPGEEPSAAETENDCEEMAESTGHEEEQEYVYTLTPIKEETPSADVTPLPVDNTPIPTNVEVLIEDMVADSAVKVGAIETSDEDILEIAPDSSVPTEPEVEPVKETTSAATEDTLQSPIKESSAVEEIPEEAYPSYTAKEVAEELQSPTKESSAVEVVPEEDYPANVATEDVEPNVAKEDVEQLQSPIKETSAVEVVPEEDYPANVATEECSTANAASSQASSFESSSRRDMLGATLMLLLIISAVIFNPPNVPKAQISVSNTKALQIFVESPSKYTVLEPARITTPFAGTPTIPIEVVPPLFGSTAKETVYPIVSAKTSLNPFRLLRRIVNSLFSKLGKVFGFKQNA